MALFREVFRNWSAKVAAAILLLVVVVAVFAPLIQPTSAYLQDSNHLLAPPSARHLLGTDYLGRDTLSRLILGTRLSLLGALEALGIGFALGVVPGLFSSFMKGVPRFLVLRVVDSFMTLPAIVFTIGVVAVFGETQTIAMAAIGVLFAPAFFRVVRAASLGYANAQYVEMARLFGAGRLRVIRTHVWRKVLPTMAVTATSTLAAGILAVSSLSYLGVGSQPPLPTWGGMLASDMNYLSKASYSAIFPGIAIALTVGALGIIADSLRDATRPGVRYATAAEVASDAEPELLGEAALEPAVA